LNPIAFDSVDLVILDKRLRGYNNVMMPRMMRLLLTCLPFLAVTTRTSGLSDRDVLNNLFDDTYGDTWERGWDNWRDPMISICEWEGVTCTEGAGEEESVLAITLNGNNMTGEVPLTQLLQLPNLQELNLEDNDVTYPEGIVSEDLFDENKNGITSKLRHLNLGWAYLYSVDPIFGDSNFVSMPDLVSLKLNSAYLDEEFPTQIFQLTNLEELDLGGNEIGPDLPDGLFDLTKLRILNLGDCQFEGEIPPKINQLTNLEVIDLGDNVLQGQIPNGFSGLTQMMHLDVGANYLLGPLPTFENMSKLKSLDVSQNNLSGQIPSGFLSNINTNEFLTLDIGGNRLTGNVPSLPFSNLKPGTFQLYDNKISGIDSALCSSAAAAGRGCNGILCPPGTYNYYGEETSPDSEDSADDDGTCHTCALTQFWGATECKERDPTQTEPSETSYSAEGENEDELLKLLYDGTGGPQWYQSDNWNSDQDKCDWYGIECNDDGSVTGIILSNNGLVGKIPEELFGLPNLDTLRLGKNRVAVPMESIPDAERLEVLDLSFNPIGDLEGIDDAESLVELILDNCDLLGPFPEELLELYDLERLSINNNKIKGEIPEDIDDLESLEILSLNDNDLTGAIPPSLSGLLELRTLSLSGNKFEGAIPDFLNTMTSLEVIDLSNQFGRDSDKGFTGNLPAFDGLPNLERLDLSFNQLEGAIPISFLDGVNTEQFHGADLRGNKLNGEVPVLPLLDIDLTDNMFTSVNDDFCQKFVTLYDSFECDAILCPVGTFNEDGRQQADDRPCMSCPKATFMGLTYCPDENGKPPNKGELSSQLTELEILQRFYADTGGAEWTMNTGWMENDDYCDWYGIECNYGSVIALDMSDNGLSGTVGKEIFFLKFLETLVLNDNNIEMNLNGIGKADSLMSLEVASCGLKDVVGIEKAVNLETLTLSDNHIAGKFPEGILKLRKLQELALDDNDLTGTIPDFELQPDLNFLDLSSNFFTGPIPDFNLPEMSDLSLSDNYLSGVIPHGILAGMPELHRLDLSMLRNEDKPGLSGQLPSFANIPKLNVLVLNHNSFTGQIPADFMAGADIANLKLVALDDNKLTGNIPNLFPTSSVKLESVFGLVNNQFTSISPDLCARVSDCNTLVCPPGTWSKRGRQHDGNNCDTCPGGTSFYGSTICASTATPPPTHAPIAVAPTAAISEAQILDKLFQECGGTNWQQKDGWEDPSVSYCDRFGIICEDRGAGLSVVSITLIDNNLIGTPPLELYQLENLEKLVLKANDILFDFTDIARASNLQVLNLEHTKIVDVQGVGNAKSLVTLSLSNNALMPESIDEIMTLSNLNELYLSHNQQPFNVALSAQIGLLKKLRKLSMQGSGLIGQIPPEIGQLEHLAELDLSHNQIIETIPNTMNEMTTLTSIDVSNNGLSGPLPDFSRLTRVEKLDLSFNSFTGVIPPTFLSSDDALPFLEKLDLSNNKLSGGIPQSFARISDRISDGVFIGLSGNEFTGIDPMVCNSSPYGCDGIVCSIGKFNLKGKQTSDSDKCDDCSGNGAPYLGTKECLADMQPVTQPVQPPVQAPVQQPVQQPVAQPVAQPVQAPFQITSKSSYALTKFFEDCDGDSWNNNEDWETTDVCDWDGIYCEEGKVIEIYIGQNNIECIPPQELYTHLDDLKTLSLYGNAITMSFFDIARAKSLENLYLDNTATSELKGLEKATQLKRLSLRGCGIDGKFPSEIMSLTNLEYLSLANNRLTGTLPSNLSTLEHLEVLVLSNNEFMGGLDVAVFSARMRMVDLSENNIDGPIPSTFLLGMSQNNWIDVDLSNNLLTGTVPASLGRFNRLNVNLGNNYFVAIDDSLCGKMLWNEGDVGEYGCNALLCPFKTSAETGRQTSKDDVCVPCNEAEHLGSSMCHKERSSGRSLRIIGRVVGMAISAMSLSFIIW